MLQQLALTIKDPAVRFSRVAVQGAAEGSWPDRAPIRWNRGTNSQEVALREAPAFPGQTGDYVLERRFGVLSEWETLSPIAVVSSLIRSRSLE
jgi:hypothetical protein